MGKHIDVDLREKIVREVERWKEKTAKLVLSLVTSLSLLLTSCEGEPNELQQRQADIANRIHKEWTNNNKPKVYLFTYKGHDMVYMVLHEGTNHAIGGFFHDPECRKCKGHIEEVSKANPEELSEYEKLFEKH